MRPEGVARITIPPGGTIKYALEFAAKNRDWLLTELESHQSDWGDGDLLFWRGELTPLKIAVLPDGSTQIFFGPFSWINQQHSSIKEFVRGRLRALAESELVERTFHLAKMTGLEISRVRVREQRSRWGSCSSLKTLSLNWKLVQTPDSVRDYIIFHELMHLREMNHSPRFWAHVQAVCPQWRQAERWLRKHSRQLR